MSFQKRTAEDVVARPDAGLPPEGYYPVVMTGVSVKETKATQGMMFLTFSPCREPGKPKTVVPYLEFDHMLLSDNWTDDQEFCASRAEKIATEKGIRAAEVSDTAISLACDEAVHNAQMKMRSAALALLGADKAPAVPAWDKTAKRFVRADGSTCDKVEKQAAWNAHVAWCCSQIAAVASGELDIRGYVCVAKVVHDEWNGEKRAKAVRLSEKLPPEESFVPVSEWP